MKKYLLLILIFRAAQSHTLAQSVLTKAPDKPDLTAKYIFYFHGTFLENNPSDAVHPLHGRFEYEKIKEAFRLKGFIVISEQRPEGTDANEYASTIAAQIRGLIKKGVQPNQITAVGGSKGSYIAQFLSSRLQNRYVNYVILAGCNETDPTIPAVRLSGNVLSIYEASDSLGQSCQYLKDSASALVEFKEIRVELGIKHKIVYQPYSEWMNPAIEWASRFAGQAMKVTGTELLPAQLAQQVRKEKAYLIDVRTPEEYQEGFLQDAALINFKASDFEANIKKLDKKKPVYLYCRSGNRSGKARFQLIQWGFHDVHNIGGFNDLASQGLPVAIQK